MSRFCWKAPNSDRRKVRLQLPWTRPDGSRGSPVGAGLPAKQSTRCMAPAAPVFAGEPAPTGYVLA
ncbi:hypothetical protein E8E78_18455 [Pseudomonas sp. BN505]|nr:hypothetical protein [Pseudomonas sp. BN605]MDH4858551.1 hypothetical protein [Pseudomonas sp. BN505]NTY90302.1 hypothetical protein [Pseudomonas putida]NTY98844.1 hypothetical protein [Pseudomonas putida]NTZ21127.1 hypothetical protein [Pseudomonas putida]